MTDACKPAVNIEISHDGEVVRGWYQEWTWGLGNVNVCFNGISKGIPVPESSLHDNAVAAFRELVSENWQPILSIPDSLPPTIRYAAFKYVNGLFDGDGELEHARELINAISDNPDSFEARLRIAWFCINALKAVTPAWSASCDDNVPNELLKLLRDHVNETTVIQNWDVLCRPPVAKRNGQRIVDCVSCMVLPIAEAIANCATFIQSDNLDAATNVLYYCDVAQDEGAWNCGDSRFAEWLVKIALPPSIRIEEMPDSHIYQTL